MKAFSIVMAGSAVAACLCCFDVVVTDESHRSIYGAWQAALLQEMEQQAKALGVTGVD